MANKNPGDTVTLTGTEVGSKPKWMSWTASNQLSGTAQLPSGYRKITMTGGGLAPPVNINPVSLPSSNASWRMAIYAPNGSYITATGTGDIPTIGTPVVRIGVNAPSKAVVRIPVLKNTSGNILASTFNGWSDGHTGKVDRGMELTVEYRDADTGSLRMAFRGMIYQIESGDVITITAYDRLMDLAQFSDQYQSYAGYTQDDTSVSRTISGSNYIYTMNNSVGTLLSASAVNALLIDCLSTQTWDYSHDKYKYYIKHPLPKIGAYSVNSGYKILKLSVNYTAYYTWLHLGTHTVAVSGKFILYKNGVAIAETAMTEFIHKTQSSTTNITASGTLTLNVNWAIEGSTTDYMIGAYVEGPRSNTNVAGGSWGYDYKSGFDTVTSVYQSDDGSSWTQLTGDHPEIAMTFSSGGYTVNISDISASGSTLTVNEASIPVLSNPPQYLSTVDKGIQLIVSYFITGSMGIREIVQQLLGWAGLDPDVINDNMGSTTYYTSSTYDYMTCILELLKNGNYGVQASIDKAGKAYVRSRHTISETPMHTYTTDPSASGEQVILSHDLTAHWMAEKATPAYIAEDTAASGLPVALETDDMIIGDLMGGSLVEIMQSPLRSVIVDSTLGTHSLQAYAAGGKVVQLHVNVFEGKMTLAGYRLGLWDLSTAYVGGMPIGINVPEYGAQGTAVPTEIILGDGVTQVSLDNIRTADRSEMANAMGLSSDAISNNASAVPESVYIFARMDTYTSRNGLTFLWNVNPSQVKIYLRGGGSHAQTNSTYIRTVEDGVGYMHIMAIFRAVDYPSGYATLAQIDRVSFTYSGTEYFATFNNPKYAFDGQNVHVDIRVKMA